MLNLYRILGGKLGHVPKKKFVIERVPGKEYDMHKGTGYLTGNGNGFEKQKGGENMKKTMDMPGRNLPCRRLPVRVPAEGSGAGGCGRL